MEIRKAKNEDIEQIITIIKEIAEIHVKNRPDIFKKKDKSIIRNWIENVIQNENEVILVASNKNDTIYGVLIYQIKEIKEHINLIDKKKLWIDELGVFERYRGQGIGKKLLQEAEQIARELECDSIELNCWDFNKEAIEFYEKNGIITQRRIMEKRLEGLK